MPYNIRMVPEPTTPEAREALRPGDMYHAPYMLEQHNRYKAGGGVSMLSDQYFKESAAKRPPLVLVMPDASRFVVDSRFFGKTGAKDENGRDVHDYYGEGWQVTGEPPAISLSPSVNIVGSYHGMVQNGVIGDDLDGRKEKHAEHWRTLGG